MPSRKTGSSGKKASAARRREATSRAAPPERRRRPPETAPAEPEPEALPPAELYRREKQRRLERGRTGADKLEEARQAYAALLASDAAKAKGGRPRKTAQQGRTPRR